MYGVIDCSFWTDRRFQGITGQAREALLYLLSSPHGNHIGCYRISPEYMALDLEWTAEDARDALLSLQKYGLVKYDWDQEVVFVPLYAKWNPLKRGNMDKAACSDAKNLPPSPLVYEWILLMRAMYPGFRSMLDEVEADANCKNIPTVYQQSLEIEGTLTEEREDSVRTVLGQCQDTVGTVAGQGKGRVRAGVVRTHARERVEETATSVLEYINRVTQRVGAERLRSSPDLNGRIREGATDADAILVFEYKLAEWGEDDKMAGYVKPSTIFSKGHFADYLRAARMWAERGRPAIGPNGSKARIQSDLDAARAWAEEDDDASQQEVLGDGERALLADDR